MTQLDRLRTAYPPLPDDAPPAATVARLQSLYAEAVGASRGVGAFRRVHRRRSRRIGLLALGAVVLSGTAVAATGGWRPLLGSADQGPRPTVASAGLPPEQLAALAVLRRPQTDVDRGPLVQKALHVLNRHVIDGIHTDAIRVISRGPLELVLLVPAQRQGHPIRGVPPSISTRRDVLCLMAGSYQRPRSFTITSGTAPKTIDLPAGYRNWGVVCGTLHTLRTSGIQTGTSPDGSGGVVADGHRERIVNRRVTLVPDDVARVKIRLRGRRDVTVPVRDNVYSYTIRGIPASLGADWFDEAGHQIGATRYP